MPQATIPLARNHASGGPVAEQAERLAESLTAVWIRDEKRPESPPDPPLVMRTLADGGAGAEVVSVDASGILAISGGNGGTIRIWNTATGRLLHTVKGSESEIKAVRMTPDGATAVSYGCDGMIRVWDVGAGTCRQAIQTNAKAARHLAVTADGRIAITAAEDTAVLAWDLATGTLVRTLGGHTKPISSLDVTPDGRLAVSGAGDDTVRIWDLARGKTVRTITVDHAHEHLAAISANGRIVVSAFREYLLAWDAVSGRVMEAVTCSEYPHIDSQSLAIQGLHYRWVCAALAADGRTVVGAAERDYMGAASIGMLTVLDVTAATLSVKLAEPASRVSSMAASADGRICVVAYGRQSPRVMDLAGKSVPGRRAHMGVVTDLCLLTEEKRKVVSVGSDYAWNVWELDTGKPDRHIGLGPGGWLDLLPFLPLIRHVKLAPDGTTALCAPVGSDLFAMEFGSRTVLRTLKETVRGVSVCRSMVLMPDGRGVVSVQPTREIISVSDLATGLVQRTHPCPGELTASVAVTPDGAVALSSGPDHTMDVWDLRTSRTLRVMPAGDAMVVHIIVTPDGRTVISRNFNGDVRVLNTKTGGVLRTIEIPCPFNVHSLIIANVPFAVSPDGRYAVAADRAMLGVWDTFSGACVAVHSVGSNIIVLSALTPAGQFVCGTENGDLHFLTVRNLGVDAPWQTAARLFLRKKGEKLGHWDDALTTDCQWCGRRFQPDAGVLEAIGGITRSAGLSADQSPCLALPDDAWEEKRLLARCPHCRGPVRFNPFVVDNRGGYAPLC